jgi:glycosyltransferase involved in cell wall biosynthesis
MNDKVVLPTISVVTPSLNQGDFIEETILSVLDQNYPNLEYIVIDGGSKDKTIKILKKYHRKIKWKSSRDKGQADAINKGMRMATGEILCYLNSDDILLKDSLITVGKLFATQPNIQWLAGRCSIIDHKSKEVRKAITCYKNLLLKTRSKKIFLITDFISQPAVFWRRELVNIIGLFDATLHYVMDYDYWLRLWKISNPFFMDRNLAEFRIHTKSKTMTTAVSQNWGEEEKKVLKQHSNSKFYFFLHELHRNLISSIYQVINS